MDHIPGAMDTCYASFDEFRTKRRRSEYVVLIDLLPNVICNIILDYAQLDDKVIDRINNISTKFFYKYIFFLGWRIKRVDFIIRSKDLLDVTCVKCNIEDIFASCYSEDSMFARQLADPICHVSYESSHKQINDLIKKRIINPLRWPSQKK